MPFLVIPGVIWLKGLSVAALGAGFGAACMGAGIFIGRLKKK